MNQQTMLVIAAIISGIGCLSHCYLLYRFWRRQWIGSQLQFLRAVELAYEDKLETLESTDYAKTRIGFNLD